MLAFLPGFKQRFKQQAFKTPGFEHPENPSNILHLLQEAPQTYQEERYNSKNHHMMSCHTVDGSEIWANSPVEGLVVYPIFLLVFVTGFLPSALPFPWTSIQKPTTKTRDFSTQKYRRA